MKFYDSLEPMECLQGDTLPVFTVDMDEETDLSGSAMLLIAEQQGNIILQKNCSVSDHSFTVQLTDTDTADLTGNYTLHFRFTDSNGRIFRKIAGTLKVIRVSQGA